MGRKRVWRPVVALCTRLVTFSIKLTRTYANIMRLICSVPICSLTPYVCMTTRRSLLDNNYFAPATQILESRRSELKELKGGSEGRECIAS